MSNSTSFVVPAAFPPDSVIANFDDPHDVYYTADLTVGITCLVVVNILFFIHAYVKWGIKRGKILLEDGSCVIAWVLVNANIMAILQRCVYGEGRLLWELSLTEYQKFLKWMYIGSTIYSPAAFFTKVTLLLLIARVFSTNPRVSRWIHIFIVILILAYLPVELLKIFLCQPVSAYWEMRYEAGADGDDPTCFDPSALFMCDISIAIVTDFIILVLPIPLVWSMETNWRQKLKIAFLLGAGGVATAVTMMRAHFNVQLMETSNITTVMALSSITTTLELAIGLSCACLPSANLLFEKTVHSVSLPCFQSQCRETQTRPDSRKASDATTSSHWSSIISKITVHTVHLSMKSSYDTRTQTTRRNQHDSDDVETGSQYSPVVVIFNNPLDVQSIRSRTTSEGISRSSMEEAYHPPDVQSIRSRTASEERSRSSMEEDSRDLSVLIHEDPIERLSQESKN